ncbi:MAG: GHKL domain-containing protein [Geobacter sp.]|nr:GHKL domain-containing protein [Geobacter sp.]
MRTALLFSFFLLLTVPALAEERTGSPSVLILDSYHHSYTWSDRELDGIIETLSASGLKPEIHVEFMDSKNFPKNEHFEQLSALFAVKYGKNRPSIIIVLDNPAFEFAISYRKALFNNIPIVFAGLNDYEPAMLKGETAVTGVVEKQDLIGTVKLAQLIQPDLKEVVVLHDFTSSGLASRKEAEEQFVTLSGGIKFRYLPDMPIEKIVATIKELKPGTALLPFSYSRDFDGKIFTHAELTKLLGDNSAVPVYGTKVERLGYGIIGGNLLEGKSHGAQGAALAVRILRGEQASAIPVIAEPKSSTMFDYNYLKKFRIKLDSLPPDSTIINRPPGLYKEHALVINISGGIILLLSGSLAFIIYFNRKRLAAEEALIMAERGKTRLLEAANSEMESFCYAVSHDLQAPLRHINSFCTILGDEYGDRLDGEGNGYLERMKAATVRMGNLIRDLLMLSQVARGELSRQEFDLGVVARTVFDELQQHDKDRMVKITIDKGMTVAADLKLVRVALDNLLSNAWKYTSKRADAAIHLGFRDEDGQRIFFVADNGAGFDMQYAEKLFAPFQRLHSESEYEGSGVGLATVQRIVNRHGGQIRAEGAPDGGATFFFTLQP